MISPPRVGCLVLAISIHGCLAGNRVVEDRVAEAIDDGRDGEDTAQSLVQALVSHHQYLLVRTCGHPEDVRPDACLGQGPIGPLSVVGLAPGDAGP